MENDTQNADKIYLKPSVFDLVMEVIAGLLLLFLWGIALGPFVFPESYTDRFDQSFAVINAVGWSLLAVVYYRIVRFPRFVKNNCFGFKITKENAERQYRIGSTCSRIFLIVVLTSIVGCSTRKIRPLEIIYSLWEVSMDYNLFLYSLMCLLIWSCVRSWMLR